MGAGSRFDQPLTLIEDGHKVIACGPLQFQGCDVRAEVTIELVQPGHGRAVTTKVFPNKNFNKHRCDEVVGDEEDEWMMRATVEPDHMHAGCEASIGRAPRSSRHRAPDRWWSATASSRMSGGMAPATP
jgi:hypothetical protein